MYVSTCSYWPRSYLNSLGPIVCTHAQRRNLTTIAKKLCLCLHGEIQLLLFASEAAPNTTPLEKHAATEIASFKEANVHIIGFAKKSKEKKQAK